MKVILRVKAILVLWRGMIIESFSQKDLSAGDGKRPSETCFYIFFQ